MDLEETLPMHRPVPPEAVPGITFWVIYDRPKDYPHGCVLRAQWAKRTVPNEPPAVLADTICWYAATVEELHTILPPGVVRVGPAPDDDPCIAEVWMV